MKQPLIKKGASGKALSGLMVLASVILTHLLQRLTPHPNYLIGAIISALAPASSIKMY